MNEKTRITQDRIKQLINAYCEGSQQKFADRCGVSKFSVSQYVNGSNAPGNVSAAKIAKAFGLDPLWVMGFDVPIVEEQPTVEHVIENVPDPYYLDSEARKMAQFLLDHPGHRALLDASRRLSQEDLSAVVSIVNRMKSDDGV